MSTQDEYKFMCPRPRSTRACESCRSRKVRCLPSEKPSSACRRCIKLGYDCTLTSSNNEHSSTNNPSRSSSSGVQNEDVVASLFRNAPKHGDQSAMCELHRQMMRKQLLGDDTSRGAQETSHSTTTPPLTQTSTSNTDYKNLRVSMKEADELLSHFQSKKVYFPFVDVPDNISAASMAKTRPFLFLAILTISATRRPLLQRKLDERFRRVLSERIVLQGDKSLDYVQGLLVYLAWHPIHLRPLNNQMWQYVQILRGMLSDLRFDQRLHETAARNACLGCYNLSSLFALGFQRRSDSTLYEIIKSTIEGTAPIDQDNSHHTLLSKTQMLWETVARTSEQGGDNLPNCSLSFHLQIQDIERKIRSETSETASLRISILSLKVVTAYLPWMVHSPSSSRKSPHHPRSFEYQPCEHVKEARSCLAEIRGFFDYFLSLPADQYIYFSIREWCQLILTISTASQICFLIHPFMNTQWYDFQTKARSTMRIYLESLLHRMTTLSVSKTGATPDIFCMFRSVLDVVLEAYAVARINSPLQSDPDPSVTEGTDSPSVGATSTTSRRCPMMNGSIKQTEFWEAVQQSNTLCGGVPEATSSDRYAGAFGAGMDGLFDDAQDWPSLFSEWVSFT
ncbi:Zn(II)2Cys6 transcription factor domain-containing protein [Aspergillus fijiensis CBS 313.89]|uniref:Zn(2)-C6 fungal-type domain-containing protein n=1 Tax=Aspergillus fijiensis CBS 313.89 TaxID=1448319 RepID=A0A8G1W4G7_9EURO|nr:uncharacterized protein BO72DRAFT_525413 [Aspergillus fijiensis CBS 313.89]RAK80149.1 hypothetical protein BO72DRAFT_525413 [Aspergillus fijiensis CBS 313.89]